MITADMISAIEYEINDGELYNDVLVIIGEPNAEICIRGYSPSSIKKYGRRTYKLSVPIGANEQIVRDLIVETLDKYSIPRPIVRLTIIGNDESKLAIMINTQISDIVELNIPSTYLSGPYTIESISIRPIGLYLEAEYILRAKNV